MELIDEDFNVFQNAVEKNSFGEENFQNALYHCFSYSGNEIDCTAFVNLYAKFGIIIMKLVNMLESSKNSYDDHMRNYFDDTKRISDQDVIENLSSDHNYIDELDKNHIFQYLLNLSCAKETQSSLSEVELITEKDLDKEFDNELYNINKKSILFLKRSYFLNEVRTVFSNCV
ncbi:unnamed protein product [Rotaria sp. Silwood1]|nr:unnamed protein product [Rotaria sp. Silwood1]CAF0961970.1 unnamed protein product [Rotaria sp. Silwood1]CAF3375765.1 unnamed protein product [Rotaria sp. Silwood1]CAF3404549.1 unnamed protein product [Rotaria sp. Silwood1]CAF3410893.1 unnamed protein product [Rotaria sp. Silwood1]